MATDDHYAPVPDGFIRLVSKDGFEFLVKEEYALVSNVIKMMLNVDFKESRTRVIRFPEVEAVVLEKVCQYMYHHQRTKSAVGSKKGKALRGMDGTASFDIEPDIVVKMLLFASFLDL